MRVSRRNILKLLALAPLLPVGRLPPLLARLGQQDDLPPNIVLLVFDTLSASHLSLHGYPRLTSPNLSRFAERATVYHAHRSAGNFTTPGTASLLTGTYPWSHRALQIQGRVLDRFRERSIFHELADRGYYRLAYTHNLAVSSLLYQFEADIDYLAPISALALADFNRAEHMFPRDFTPAVHAESTYSRRGDSFSTSLFLYHFDRWWQDFVAGQAAKPLVPDFPRGLPGGHDLIFLLEDAIDWSMLQLSSIPSPFFAYLHFLPPHDPYNPRREFVGIFDDGWAPPGKPWHALTDEVPEESLNEQRRLYDEHIAYVDSEFGRLARFIEESGLAETTYLIVTSDHGELFERGILKHITPVLFEPIIRVPLLVSAPGQRERIDVRTPTSSVDIVPTLLQVAGLDTPSWCEGEVLPSVEAAFNANGGEVGRATFALEAKRSERTGSLSIRSVAATSDRYKLVRYRGYENYSDAHELYDLAEDPEELNDVYRTRPEIARELEAILDSQWRHAVDPEV